MKKLILAPFLFFCFHALLLSQNYCPYNTKTINYGFFPVNTISLTSGWVLSERHSDEFNGNGLDSPKWTRHHNFVHSTPNKAAFMNYNVSVEDGMLNMSMREENPPLYLGLWHAEIDKKNYYYSSGYIYMNDSIRYGYFETRCFIPDSPCKRPCFWLFGGAGDNYGEIDVFERQTKNNDYLLMQNVYRNVIDSFTVSKVQQDIIFNDRVPGRWATFAVEWLPKEITFYINGNITSRLIHTDDEDIAREKNIFTCANIDFLRYQKIQLTYSMDSLIFPLSLHQKFQVDYVRSYKLKEGLDEYWPVSLIINDLGRVNESIYKVHKKLKLGGAGHTATIHTTRNITLWASEEIVFDKGFEVSAGTPFTARRIDTVPELFFDNMPTNK